MAKLELRHPEAQDPASLEAPATHPRAALEFTGFMVSG